MGSNLLPVMRTRAPGVQRAGMRMARMLRSSSRTITSKSRDAASSIGRTETTLPQVDRVQAAGGTEDCGFTVFVMTGAAIGLAEARSGPAVREGATGGRGAGAGGVALATAGAALGA